MQNFHHFKIKTNRKFQSTFIYGERNSGTSFLYRSIIYNFDIVNPLGDDNHSYFKSHDFGFDKIYDNINYIFIVRDPIDWLISYKNWPHHAAWETKDWEKYLLSEVKMMKHNQERVNSRNHLNNKLFKNIFEFRKIKCQHLINLNKQYNNIILIRYEDLLNNYQNIMNKIKNKFKLRLKHNEIELQEEIKKPNYDYDKILDNRIKNIIKNNIDIKTERELGYEINL